MHRYTPHGLHPLGFYVSYYSSEWELFGYDTRSAIRGTSSRIGQACGVCYNSIEQRRRTIRDNQRPIVERGQLRRQVGICLCPSPPTKSGEKKTAGYQPEQQTKENRESEERKRKPATSRNNKRKKKDKYDKRQKEDREEKRNLPPQKKRIAATKAAILIIIDRVRKRA